MNFGDNEESMGDNDLLGGPFCRFECALQKRFLTFCSIIGSLEDTCKIRMLVLKIFKNLKFQT